MRSMGSAVCFSADVPGDDSGSDASSSASWRRRATHASVRMMSSRTAAAADSEVGSAAAEKKRGEVEMWARAGRVEASKHRAAVHDGAPRDPRKALRGVPFRPSRSDASRRGRRRPTGEGVRGRSVGRVAYVPRSRARRGQEGPGRFREEGATPHHRRPYRAASCDACSRASSWRRGVVIIRDFKIGVGFRVVSSTSSKT